MANIKLNLNIIEQFIRNNDLSKKIAFDDIKNIFDEANQYLEDGTKGKDKYLTGDEVPTFQHLIEQKCSEFSKYYGKLLASFTTNDDGKQTIIECNKSKEDIALYKKNLDDAKKIIETNYKDIGLTEEELQYVQKASAVIEQKGCARYDKESDIILFNI